VIAAFDQQVLHTPMSVRWGPEDVRLHEVSGFSMYLDDADISVAQHIAAGNYEQHLIRFFKAFLRPGMNVVDAGANIGLYTLLSAQCVGPAGKVWGFEPNSENCRFIIASAAKNGFTNIELFPLALGNTRGAVFFTSALGSNGGIEDEAHNNVLDGSCRVVPIVRLDDMALGPVDLMKMDIEGAEALLVRGAEQTLKASRPMIVCEFSDEMLRRISGWLGEKFLRHMIELGFDCFVFDKKTYKLSPIGDPVPFAEGFVGNGRIADLVLCPAEKRHELPAALTA
jgi:FkbM family methyltransferase